MCAVESRLIKFIEFGSIDESKLDASRNGAQTPFVRSVRYPLSARLVVYVRTDAVIVCVKLRVSIKQ